MFKMVSKYKVIVVIVFFLSLLSIKIVLAAPVFESAITVDRSGTINSTRTVDMSGVVGYLKIVDFYRLLDTPSTYGFGILVKNTTSTTGLTYFTITNKSTVPITISIKGSDMTGGITWALSDTATPSPDTLGFKAGLEGADYTIVVKKTPPYNTLVAGLGVGSTQRWGLKMWVPTSFSDGIAKSGTITLTVTEY